MTQIPCKESEKDEDDILCDSIITSEYPIDPFELLGEKNFRRRSSSYEEVGTPVQEFFRDATIFITGGTGFLGKSLLEKLLRSCPHIKRIYLLSRLKKEITAEERIEKMFQLRFFNRLRHEVTGFRDKIAIMNGNLEQPYLGLSDQDRKKFSQEVNIIFHIAASVRFSENLKSAIIQNTLATREVIKLARSAEHLEAMVHVSTAYSFPTQPKIDEKIYELPMHYEELIDRIMLMSDDELQNETSSIIGKWPNTYSFTKAVAECLIQNESEGLPISIFRPSVVVSTYNEPVRGWTDTLNGPFGLLLAVGTGITHVYPLDNKSNAVDMVPVDLTVNCMICIAKETYEKFFKSLPKAQLPIYLFCNDPHQLFTWGKALTTIASRGSQWPTIKAKWYCFFIVTKNKYLYTGLLFLFHTLPGLLLDSLSYLMGRKPMLRKVHEKIDVVTKEALEYFVGGDWTFVNLNVQNAWKNLSEEDKSLFFFNMEEVSWDYFFETVWLGARVYLLHDDIHSLPAARRKRKKLYYANLAYLSIIGVIVMYMLWKIVQWSCSSVLSYE